MASKSMRSKNIGGLVIHRIFLSRKQDHEWKISAQMV